MAVKAGDGGEEMMAEINITPFTDVLLVLLIIFMIAATAVMQNGFNINLPKAVSKEEANNANIVISIEKAGTVHVGDKTLSNDELLPYLKRLKKAKSTDRVIIMADGDCTYSKVIAVMDKAKEAELNNIALATEQPK
jgi:biopolymer transport protein ExbD